MLNVQLFKRERKKDRNDDLRYDRKGDRAEGGKFINERRVGGVYRL